MEDADQNCERYCSAFFVCVCDNNGLAIYAVFVLVSIGMPHGDSAKCSLFAVMIFGEEVKLNSV